MKKRALFDISQEDLDAIWNAVQDTKPVEERRYTEGYLKKQQAEIERRGELYGTIDLPDLSFGAKVKKGFGWLGKKLAGPLFPEKGIAPLTMPNWAQAKEEALSTLDSASTWFQNNFIPSISELPTKLGEVTGKRLATGQEIIEQFVDIPGEIRDTWTVENVKKVPEHIGNIWAFIGTMMPGQESWPSKWRDLTTEQQVIASAQSVVLVPLTYVAMKYLVVDFPTAFRSARTYNRYLLKQVKQAGKKGRVLEYADWLAKEQKTLTKIERMEVTTEEARRAAKEKRIPVATKKVTEFREERIPPTGPISQEVLAEQVKEKMPVYLANLARKYANVKVISKATGLPELQKALKLQIKGLTPVSVSNEVIEQGASDLANHFIPAYVPGQLSRKFFQTAIQQAQDILPVAVAQLQATGKISRSIFGGPTVLTPEEKIVEEEMAKPLTKAPPGEEYAARGIATYAHNQDYWEREYAKIESQLEKTTDKTTILELGTRAKEIENILQNAETGKATFIEPPPKPDIGLEGMMGGGPALGMGIEFTTEVPGEMFKESKFKDTIKHGVYTASKPFSVYYRVKKEYPEAYTMFRNFKGGQDLAWIAAKERNEAIWGKISAKDAIAIQRYRQKLIEGKAQITTLAPRLRPIAKRVDEAIEQAKTELNAMSMMKEGWPQSYMVNLNKEREKLMVEIESFSKPEKGKKTYQALFGKYSKAVNKRRERIGEIEELLRVLQDRRFFPARYIAAAENQPSITALLGPGAWTKSQVRSAWIGGKTITDIDAAIEAGLEPMDSRAGMLKYLYWLEGEKNKWTLHQGLKDNPNLALKVTKTNPPPKDWIQPRGSDPLTKDFKGYAINPMIYDVLREFDSSSGGGFNKIYEAYNKLTRQGKVFSFYNPIIMGGIYDPQQGFLAAGVGALNPINYVRSIKQVITKDPFYKECLRLDLFPTPADLGPKQNINELVMSAVRQMDISANKFTSTIERLTDGRWDFKGGTKTQNMIDAIRGLYSMEWNVTWSLDAASRMTTVKSLVNQGYTTPDAVERARFFHADYGDIPGGTRKALNTVMWTPSYQLSMAKVYGHLLTHPHQEPETLARLVGFWLLVGTGAALAGYKWQEGYRLVKQEGRKEKVWTATGPLLWMQSYLARDPVLTMYWRSSVPINIGASILWNNTGMGENVYDEYDSKQVQVAKSISFAVKRYFRPLEEAGRLRDEEVELVHRLARLAALTTYERQARYTYVKYLMSEEDGAWEKWKRQHVKDAPAGSEKRKKAYRAHKKKLDEIWVGPQQEIWQAGLPLAQELLKSKPSYLHKLFSGK